MHYFDVILLSDVIWAFGPKVTRRDTYFKPTKERIFLIYLSLPDRPCKEYKCITYQIKLFPNILQDVCHCYLIKGYNSTSGFKHKGANRNEPVLSVCVHRGLQ